MVASDVKIKILFHYFLHSFISKMIYFQLNKNPTTSNLYLHTFARCQKCKFHRRAEGKKKNLHKCLAVIGIISIIIIITYYHFYVFFTHIIIIIIITPSSSLYFNNFLIIFFFFFFPCVHPDFPFFSHHFFFRSSPSCALYCCRCHCENRQYTAIYK